MPCGLPAGDIIAYAKIQGDDPWRFFRVQRALDGLYLDWANDRREASRKEA